MNPNLPQCVTLYYAEWCNHSKAFFPEWTKFKTMIFQLGLEDLIDTCDRNFITMTDYERSIVAYYPTIRITQNNKDISVANYKAERTALNLFKECGYDICRIIECLNSNNPYYDENDGNISDEDINYEISCIEI